MDSEEPPTIVRDDPTSEVELNGGGEAIWHIAFAEGQTQGPYTTGELVGLREARSIRDDMLVWQEGWTEWRPLGEIAEIIEAPPLEMTAVERPRAKAALRRGPVAFDAPVAMGDDPFGSGDAPVQRSPRVSAAEAMKVGQSREGTVEINMNEFRKLSATSPGGTAAVLKSLPTMREDSGLIDVAKAREEHEQKQDEEQKQALVKAQIAPIGIPTGPGLAPPRMPADFRTKVLAATVALGMVLATTVAVVAITHGPETAPAAKAPLAARPVPAPIAAPPVTPAPAPAQPTLAEELAAKDHAADTQGEAATEGATKRSTRRGAGSARTSRTRATETSGKDEGGNTIDDLLGRALDPSKSKKSAKSNSGSSLPDTPSRSDVVSAMSGVKGKVSHCKGSGVATARVTVKGSTGRVSDAGVSGVSGPAAACVERAVKGAHFPRFKQSSFTVKFPFKLGG